MSNAQFSTAQPGSLYLPASIGRRLANLFLDQIFLYIFSVIVGFIAGFIFALVAPGGLVYAYVLVFLAYFFYYVFFESIWQRTPAKWITGTKVVMRDGTKPDFWHILGRTLLRDVPFETLSFLANANPTGWHDRWSGTMVVPAEYSQEDVLKIDLTKRQRSGAGIIITVIVGIFVGIAVIGLLAAIVFASLDTARQKGRDAARVADIKQLQLDLELYYDANNAYPASLGQLVAAGDAASLPSDPSGGSYDYYSCAPTSYHLGTSLEESIDAGSATTAHSGPLCEQDPIDGSTGGKCEPTDAGSYCYDVTSSTD